MEEERKKEKTKRKTPQNCKSPTQRRQTFITTIESVTEYTQIYIHPYSKSKQSNKNKVQQIYLVNKGNQKLYLPVKNKTKAQTGKQN